MRQTDLTPNPPSPNPIRPKTPLVIYLGSQGIPSFFQSPWSPWMGMIQTDKGNNNICKLREGLPMLANPIPKTTYMLQRHNLLADGT